MNGYFWDPQMDDIWLELNSSWLNNELISSYREMKDEKHVNGAVVAFERTASIGKFFIFEYICDSKIFCGAKDVVCLVCC